MTPEIKAEYQTKIEKLIEKLPTDQRKEFATRALGHILSLTGNDEYGKEYLKGLLYGLMLAVN